MITAKEIKTIRKTLGMTQEQFASALGVAYLTVNRWENGRAAPSRLALNALQAFRRKAERILPKAYSDN